MNEKQRLYKQARKARHADRGRRDRGGRRKKWRDGESGADGAASGLQKMPGRRAPSLDYYVEQLLEQGEVSAAAPPVETIGARSGVVVQVSSGRCHVEDLPGEDGGNASEATISVCALSAAHASLGSEPVVIGDRVLYRATTDSSIGSVEAVLPRRTQLARRDPAVPKRVKVVAANIDRVVIVAAAKNPPLRPRLIDRYLIAIEQGGAEALLAINKCDLIDADGDELRSTLAPYRRVGIPVVLCSAQDGRGVEELRDALDGQTVAFVGHSGVGKSSLVGALDPSLELRTQAVTTYAGKGTHTTTASTLYKIAPEIRVIDTPGIREFGIAAVGKDELRGYFGEFEEHAANCKFSDCTHDHEPKCGVREASERGEISRERWETYRRLLAEL